MIDPATGQEIPYSREAIGDVLSMEELAEVFAAVSGAGKASPEDKKKSELPPSSGAASCANHVSENVEK